MYIYYYIYVKENEKIKKKEKRFIANKWTMQTPLQFYMPPVGFGFTFAMLTRSPNKLSSGLEGFPGGT